ncbi:hypothetical protein [Roseivirga sp.]|uniref:hypothetical protein n=1 Tax=Roseivirga sp. TaxID=1964215 RepID=UPI002B27180D|nr:hypothetical protein [Roseivirga sp.]
MHFGKYILVIGPSEKDFLNAVQSMADLYSNTEFVKDIKTFKSNTNENQYLLSFTNSPDFERFKYFVNYLNYAEIQDYSAKVLGFWTIEKEDKLPDEKLGKRVLLYVSDSDDEGDNVYAVFEGEYKTYKMGFGIGHEYSELETKEFDFAEPKITISNFEAMSKISPDPNAKPPSKLGNGCALAIVILIVSTIGVTLILN